MRKLFSVLAFCAATINAGCVASHYTKTIAVTKDAQGNIIQTVETESVIQPGQGWPVKFELLKGVQTGN